MGNYSFSQFRKDVESEAAALKQNATSEEIGNISLQSFNASEFSECIYGQMTGDCRSDRASQLILACCPRFFKNDYVGRYQDIGFMHAKENANGKTIDGVKDWRDLQLHRGDNITHFSAIEAYILIPGAKIANLIAYLKGETETVDL